MDSKRRDKIRQRIAAALITANCIAIASASQLHTLEDRIQRRNQPDAPLIEERSPSGFVYDMATVLETADLVIYATVEAATATLGPDHRNLQTDYIVAPMRTLWPKSAVGTSTPGVKAPRIVVKRFGGELTINGVAVTQREADYPAFHAGDHLLLALQFDSRDQKYVVASDVGAFAVEDEHLRPWVPNEAYAHYRGMVLAQFESDLQRLHAAAR